MAQFQRLGFARAGAGRLEFESFVREERRNGPKWPDERE